MTSGHPSGCGADAGRPCSAPSPGRGVLARLHAVCRWARARDALALAVLALCTAVYLWPGLSRLASFGPFDWGVGNSPLGAGLYPHVHNWLNGDVIDEMVPWNSLNWRLIHQGQFPLWNPYSLLGLPQFFNFQSSVLSLPDLVGYLFPERLSFLVAVACKLLIAAYGAYFCARVLGIRPLGALLAAGTFAFGGPFANEIGWPLADVMAWTGWIFGFVHLLWSHRDRRRRNAILLACVIAFAIFGGFPEACVILAMGTGTFLAILVVHRAWRQRTWDAHALGWISLAALLGLCLAAPLWLPGLQLLAGSAKLGFARYAPLPRSAMLAMLFQGYYGYPLAGSAWFGPVNYYETAAYVGVIALCLAALAVLRGYRRGQVLALAIVALVSAVVVYDPGPIRVVIQALPYVRSVQFARARLLLSFAIAVLAGLGLNDLPSLAESRGARRAYWLGVGAVGAAVAAIAVRFGWTLLRRTSPLTPLMVHIRLHSFSWPTVSLVLLLAVGLVFSRRLGRHSAGREAVAICGVVGVQLAFLVTAGLGVNSYSARFRPQTGAATALQRQVGTGLLAFDGGEPPQTLQSCLGWMPELNVAYGLAEFAAYDPMLPTAYATAWTNLDNAPVGPTSVFAPSVGNVDVARTFGIQYVLVPVTQVRLSASYGPRVAALLSRAGLRSSEDAAALQTLLQVYASRLDLQRAYPPGSTGLWPGLLGWAGQVASSTVEDCDSDLLGPFGQEWPQLAAAIEANAGLGPALQAVIESAPPPNPLPGAIPVTDLGSDILYRIPGAQRFGFLGPRGAATVESVRQLNDYTWRLVVDVTHRDTLAMRLTDVPGWHVSSDGRPLPLKPWHDVMLQSVLTPGRHVIVLRYWPVTFSWGLALAVVGLMCMAVFGLGSRSAWLRRRARRQAMSCAAGRRAAESRDFNAP